MSERVAQWIEQIVGPQNFALGVFVLILAGLLVCVLVYFFFYWIGKKIDQRAVEGGLVTQAQLDKEKRERLEAAANSLPDFSNSYGYYGGGDSGGGDSGGGGDC